MVRHDRLGMIAKLLPPTIVVLGIPILMTTTSIGLYRSALVSVVVAFAVLFLLGRYTKGPGAA
ncbi:hypothetical protein PLANPX_0944 [Lacipirellula parvula]|uniref:Uncharacterized protein n=1 Tax=Lacipirellula parvula TaxID=2650471 RepID=A0A5K7X686_9BACT|nr:hypothetical protein PLANPX_0944 [Lacipirellula parvula]